jgi:hypothetical protein
MNRKEWRRQQALERRAQKAWEEADQMAEKFAVAGVRPWNRTGLRGGFDRLPGVVILELRWAEIAER